jgi:hypothetical protein
MNYFQRQYRELEKKIDMNHYEKQLGIKEKIQISLENRENHIIMTILFRYYPFSPEKEYIIVNPDCNKMIAEFAATVTRIEIKLDLCCVSFSST